MKAKKAEFQSIDEYIALFPKHVKALLTEMRTIINAAAPGASERISYQMPAFWLNGNLVYFAGYEHHIGFYPGGVVASFSKELSGYKSAKGSVQFPLDEPLPAKVISKIVKFRVAQNLKKPAKKPPANKSGEAAGRRKRI